MLTKIRKLRKEVQALREEREKLYNEIEQLLEERAEIMLEDHLRQKAKEHDEKLIHLN